MAETIKHLADFVSGLWQIHAFGVSGAFEGKADIGHEKADIRLRAKAIRPDISEKTINHIIQIYDAKAGKIPIQINSHK